MSSSSTNPTVHVLREEVDNLAKDLESTKSWLSRLTRMLGGRKPDLPATGEDEADARKLELSDAELREAELREAELRMAELRTANFRANERSTEPRDSSESNTSASAPTSVMV